MDGVELMLFEHREAQGAPVKGKHVTVMQQCNNISCSLQSNKK